jgi:hypothetical protein
VGTVSRRLPETMPSKVTWATLAALAFGLGMFAFAGYSKVSSWPRLQRHYFVEYALLSFFPNGHAEPEIVYVAPITGPGGRRAISADFADPKIDAALAAHAIHFELRNEKRQPNGPLLAWMRTNVYDGRTVTEKMG